MTGTVAVGMKVVSREGRTGVVVDVLSGGTAIVSYGDEELHHPVAMLVPIPEPEPVPER